MLARVENGAVVEMRELHMEDVPPHKRALWVPVVYEGEGSDARTIIEADQVRIVRFDPPQPVPQVISDRQFFQQLAHMGVITEAEALAAVGPGEVPAAMLAMVETLPASERFNARMLLTGATSFDRTHALVPMFASAFGWSDADLAAFWTEASAL